MSRKARVFLAALLMMPLPALAQGVATPASQPTASGGSGCELHVFPTRVIVAESHTGLEAALGAVPMGVLVAGIAGGVSGSLDQTAYKHTVMAAKDQLDAFLSPDSQIAQLKGANLLAALNLPAGTQIVAEAALPTKDDAAKDPAMAVRLKESEDALKAQRRLSASPSTCYSELIVTGIGYQKGPVGARLNAFFNYRYFLDKPKAEWFVNDTLFGMVPANFPAKQPDQTNAASAGVRAAFAMDFTDWARRKVKP